MASGSRSFNFGSDDVLCSYEDSVPRDSSGTMRSDHPSKDFSENRMSRPLLNIYEQEDHHRSKDDFAIIVEKCMKKYADILMRSLDGITGRISQLEAQCYKLERSVGELRGDMVQSHTQSDLKFNSLEKHMQEVHRAVQILRDKQELADTQKELAKLQTLQKESTQKPEEPPQIESKKHEDTPQVVPNNQQLALVPSSLPPQQQDQYIANHPTIYQPLPPPGYQYVQSRSQLHEVPIQSRPNPNPNPNPNLNQQAPPPQPSSFPQYPQQWTQQQHPNPNPNQQQFTGQSSPQVPPSQIVLSSQTQLRPQMPPPQDYSHYAPQQQAFSGQSSQTVPPPSQPVLSSQTQMRPQMPPQGYSHYSQPSNPLPETYPPSYAKGGYGNVAPYPMQNPMQYNRGPYNAPPPSNVSGMMPRNSPYGEFIEKAVSMGYPRDQVMSAAMKMAESGQPMDLNGLLDRLNGGSAATPHAWSG